MPHVVVRIYTDSGPLLDTAREHQAKIIDVMRDLPGLQMFCVSGDSASAMAVTIYPGFRGQATRTSCCACTRTRYLRVWRSTETTSSRHSAPFQNGVC